MRWIWTSWCPNYFFWGHMTEIKHLFKSNTTAFKTAQFLLEGPKKLVSSKGPMNVGQESGQGPGTGCTEVEVGNTTHALYTEHGAVHSYYYYRIIFTKVRSELVVLMLRTVPVTCFYFFNKPLLNIARRTLFHHTVMSTMAITGTSDAMRLGKYRPECHIHWW